MDIDRHKHSTQDSGQADMEQDDRHESVGRQRVTSFWRFLFIVGCCLAAGTAVFWSIVIGQEFGTKTGVITLLTFKISLWYWAVRLWLDGHALAFWFVVSTMPFPIWAVIRFLKR